MNDGDEQFWPKGLWPVLMLGVAFAALCVFGFGRMPALHVDLLTADRSAVRYAICDDRLGAAPEPRLYLLCRQPL
jgi:hypothetical protein